MKVKQIGEFGLIDRINKKFGSKPDKDLLVSIGDDAAAIKVQRKHVLISTDTIVENVHFNLKYTSFYSIGWKLLASNLSDIAAMGGTPKYIIVTLGLKKEAKVKDIDNFYTGITKLAKKHNVKIVGGDIVSSPKNHFFTIDIYGEVDKVMNRSGAKPGDNIYYIGPLGESALGLKILKTIKKKTVGQPFRAAKKTNKAILKRFIRLHLMPSPLVREGQKIAKYASSMTDNSDGLARCLIEVCKASGVGAEMWEDKLVSSKFKSASRSLNQNPLKLIMDGGEDYGLMFTSNRKVVNSKIKLIGKIIKQQKLSIIDPKGNKKVIKDKGFKHF